MAFKEKTNGEMGIMCSDEKTCWVACECQSGWSTSAPSGEYVYAKDDRYANGLSSMSANGNLSSMSANGNLSTMSDNYSISTMATNGGMTCYKSACPSGYYLDKPSSAFTYTSTSGTLGLTCYAVTGCSSYYATNASGTKYEYHGSICYRKICKDAPYSDTTLSGKHCSQVSYAGLQCYNCHTPDYSWCPSGFQASTCGTGYYTAETDDKECRYCSAKSGTCYKCAANTCTSEGYEDSVPSGKTCREVEIKSGSGTKTCYTDCKKDIYWPDQYYIQIKICETGAPSTTCWLDSQDVIAKLQYSTGDSETQNGSKASDFVIISPTGQNLYLMWDNSATEIPTHIGSLTPNNGELNFETNCMMRPHGACNGPSSTGFTCPLGWGGNLTNNPTAQLVTQYHNYSETMDDVTLKHIPTDQTKKVTLKLKADPVWGGGLLSGGCK